MADVVWPFVDSLGFIFLNFWVISYVIALLGSVSFGYLVMRFGLPDTRGLSRQIKLGLAGAAGLAIFFLSFVLSLLTSPEYVYIFLPAVTGAILVALQVRSTLFAPKTMRVAIPVARVGPSFSLPRAVPKQPAEYIAEPMMYTSSTITEALKTQEKPKQDEKVLLSFLAKKQEAIERQPLAVLMKKEAPAEKKPMFAFLGDLIPKKPAEQKKDEFDQFSFKQKEPVSKEIVIVKKEEPKEAVLETVQENREIIIQKEPVVEAKQETAVPAERVQSPEKKSLLAFLSKKKVEVAEPVVQVKEAAKEEVKPEAAFDERQDRYLRRRGQMVEQAKVDMLRKTEPVQPLPEVKESDKEEVPEDNESMDLEMEKGLDLTDLESVSDLSELSGMDLSGESDLADLDLESDNLAGLSKIEEVPKEKGMGCPNCKSTKSMVVYCPYCGKGLCSNCADKVRSEGNLAFYTCPTCKKEVIVKK